MTVPSWILGCIISLCGSLCANIGVNIQKYSFNKELQYTQRRNYCLQPFWLCGLVLVIAGGISDFVALAITAQTIIAPISSMNLVINLFFSSIFLKERIYSNDVIGTVLLVFGSVVSVLYGNHNDQQHTLDELISYIHNICFIIFLCILLLCIVPVCSIIILKYQPIHTQLEQLYSKQQQLLNSSDTDSIDTDTHINGRNTDLCDSVHIDVTDKNITLLDKYEQLITRLELQYHNKQILLPIAYCTLSGISASFAMLLGKCISELINTTIQGNNQFIYFSTYCYLCGTVLAVVGQLDLFARALTVYDCCTVVPMFKGVFLICSTIAGLCYFQEFLQFNTLQAIMFTTGILINITGIIVLSNRQHTYTISRSNSTSISRQTSTFVESEAITEPLLSDRSQSSGIHTRHSSDDTTVPTRSVSAVTLNNRAISAQPSRHIHTRNVSTADKLTMLFAPALERTLSLERSSTQPYNGPKHHKTLSTTQQMTPEANKIILTNR